MYKINMCVTLYNSVSVFLNYFDEIYFSKINIVKILFL